MVHEYVFSSSGCRNPSLYLPESSMRLLIALTPLAVAIHALPSASNAISVTLLSVSHRLLKRIEWIPSRAYLTIPTSVPTHITLSGDLAMQFTLTEGIPSSGVRLLIRLILSLHRDTSKNSCPYQTITIKGNCLNIAADHF